MDLFSVSPKPDRLIHPFGAESRSAPQAAFGRAVGDVGPKPLVAYGSSGLILHRRS
jgi:hypothetical protein